MTKFTLTNGKSIDKPFNKMWIIIGIILVLVIVFWQFIFFYPDLINLKEIPVVLKKMFASSNFWEYIKGMFDPQEMLAPLWQTMQMSFSGTIIGSVFALPIALFAANNVFKIKWLNRVSKIIMNLIRTIPALVLAIIGIYLVGTGVLAGIIGLTIFSFGIMSKMLYEAIETVDMNPFEALESTGANKIQAFRYAIVPQIMPVFVSYIIYIFEVNIRASAVLGFVGIEGIGAVIKVNILYHYDVVGQAIILLLLVISVIQLFSNYVRGKLL